MRMLGMSYKEHKTNAYVWQQVDILVGCQQLLTVKCRKISWFGHVCRHDTLPNIILQGTVDSMDSIRLVYHGTGQRQGMDRPVDAVIAAHGGRHMSMGSHRSGCICPITPNDA